MAEHGTLLGPLTTAWSQPARCSVFYLADLDSDWWWSGQRCVSVDGDSEGHIEDDPDCWPPRMRGVKDHDRPLNGWGFYSPGLECPIGYTAACSAIYGGEQWEIQFKPGPRETAVGCCPEGFSCGNLLQGQTCEAIVSTSTSVLQNFECSGTERASLKMKPSLDGVTVTQPSLGRVTVTKPSLGRVTFTKGFEEPTTRLYAPMFQLKFQSTDITSTTPASTSSTSTSSAPDSTSKSKAELSTGAKIGIGVGVGIGLAALVVWFILWRKKSKRTLAAELGSSPGRFKHRATPSQVHVSVFSELSGDTHPVELPARG